MKRLVRAGLVLPAALAAVTLVVLAAAGAGWALAVLAVGALALLVYHLVNIQRVLDWARGPLDADAPDGTGIWADVFSAIHRRVRTRRESPARLPRDRQRPSWRRPRKTMPDGVVALDEGNRVKWANARAIGQLGLDLAKDRNQPIANIVRVPEFVRYLESGDHGEPIVVPAPTDDRRHLAVQIVAFAVAEKLLVSRDVTEVEAVARMRRDFIANVSHELKTPLTVIAGFVETLQDLDLDARQRARFLQLMREQADSMKRLVQDLLTLSALESENNPVADEPFAAAPLLEQVAADARSLSHDQHAIDVDVLDAATVVGSRDELASAFSNLVSNAVRYTPAGGRIRLGWRVEPDGRGAFSVTDTGIGIAAEHVPRLTERFYRVDRSRSRATGGTGLGLAIVKHVLLRHQADLEIASEPGKGSTFTVRLPAARVRPIPRSGDNRAASTADAAPVPTAP